MQDHSQARTRRKGGKIYFTATVVAQVSALLRYVLLARILGPTELGLAATLTVTSSFFDMISDTGSDRFLVQDRDGDTVPVQGMVQLVYMARGLITAAALVIFAYPIALFYHSPQLALGLALLGLPALINGFLHLDIRRVQRQHDFRAQGIAMAVSEVGALLATGLAALLTHRFTAIIFGLVFRAVLMTGLSHLQAKRPYLLKWDPGSVERLTRFAAPLTVNGFLLFILSQSDRVIVGNQLGVAELGKYSAMTLLLYYPVATIAAYLHGIYIPVISAERDNLEKRGRVSDDLAGITLLLGLAMMIGFAIVAPTVAPLVFGPRFAQTAMVVGLIGILQIARFILSWPTTAALAIGRSSTVLFANLAHIVAIPTAFIGLWLLGGLTGLVTGFFTGEVFAIIVALILLNRDMKRPWYFGFGRIVEFLVACAAIIGWNLALMSRAWPWELAAGLGSLMALVWFLRREAAAIRDLWSLVERLLRSTLQNQHATS